MNLRIWNQWVDVRYDMEEKNIIIIDFDGTLCKFKFPFVGKPEPNVKEALGMLKNLGFIIKIHSCRTATYWKKDRDHHIACIENFMRENDLPYDGIIVDETMDKPIARFYVGDEAIGYRGDWFDVLEQIEERM